MCFFQGGNGGGFEEAGGLKEVMMKKIFLVLMGVIMMFGLFGCGAKKYKLIYDDYGFESEKKAYPEGAQVTVYYDFIATDTDYSFHTEPDVGMTYRYDSAHGYVFEFTMPAQDVKLIVESRNTMEYDPDAYGE